MSLGRTYLNKKKVEYNQLKQDCIDNSVVNTNVKSFYTQLKPMFEEMVSSIKSQNDCESCKDIMEKFTFSMLNKKRKHSEIINTNLDGNKNDNTSLEQMSFLGEHIKLHLRLGSFNDLIFNVVLRYCVNENRCINE